MPPKFVRDCARTLVRSSTAPLVVLMLAALPSTTVAQAKAVSPETREVRALLAGADADGVTRATALAEALVAREPRSADAHYWLARCQGATAASASSLGSIRWWRRHGQGLRRAVELEPGHVDAQLALIRFLSRAPMLVGGDLDEAGQRQQTLQQIDPVAGSLALAYVRYAHGDLDGALAANYRTLDLDPAHPEGLVALVQVLTAHRRLPEGARWIDAAIATDPSDLRAHWAIVQYAAATGHAAESALRHLDAMIALPRKDLVAEWELQWRRGEVLQHLDRLVEAEAALVRALSLQPDSTRVERSLKALRAAAKLPSRPVRDR